MIVNKSDMINGVCRYIDEQVVPSLEDDKAMQIILSVCINYLKSNRNIESLFDNEYIKLLLCEESGGYNIDILFSSISSAIEKYGYFPVTLPPIKFISPTQKELKFSKSDVNMLLKYIYGEV